MQKAAIIILNYNGEEMLRRYLPSIISFSTFPVIVADNASTDRSLELLAEHFPQVQILKLPQNRGYAGGYNEALTIIKEDFEYYILLNSDIQIKDSWDFELIDFLDLNKDFVAVQPKITSIQNQGYFDHAGAGGGFLDDLGYPYCRGRIFDSVEKDIGQYDDFIEVDWTSGACMAVRSKSFHDFGGFDSRFFAHMEEIDLCWRFRSAGFRLGYIGKVEVQHLGGATLSRSNPKKTYLNFRNSLLMLHKNLIGSSFVLKYLVRVLLDVLASVVFLFKGQIGNANAILEAHVDFHKMKKIDFVDSMASNLPSKSNHKIKSILWHYHVRKKRKFTEL
ncbi:glycosyltransferase family 2 protein [Belliella sp. R4-6]|uniref:Glycosyltransferase family 2 protein n=1 Tax=Belliella alkalica TaxID=1730871 RepID=A0ABS9VB18_9BACT|nr:glycosyltransferase family 2 protein [Belliella alkalica]MCH7413632.1 glycosyltransferase family 2 protein [Belliella alkalica]